MTTGQVGLLLMLIFGLTAFFAIGVWGINRLKSKEEDADE
jgi:cytochrome oxidase assembly protein ShyY1